jgi:hypothetical protein
MNGPISNDTTRTPIGDLAGGLAKKCKAKGANPHTFRMVAISEGHRPDAFRRAGTQSQADYVAAMTDEQGAEQVAALDAATAFVGG